MFVIDRAGEMPEGAVRSPPVPVSPQPQRPGARVASPSYGTYGNGAGSRSRSATPLGATVAAPIAAPLPSRFPAYDDADADAPRAGGTPEPIKVTRAKKKGGGSGKEKKKRTTKAAEP